MSIRKQIAKSNICMVIVPVILIFIVSGILFLSYFKIYGNPNQALEDYEEKSEFAQDIIAEFSNRMQYSKNNMNELQAELQKILLEAGFYSEITNDNNVITSNYTTDVKTIELELGGGSISNTSSFVIYTKNAYLIRNSFQKESRTISITAINPNYMVKNVNLKEQIAVIKTYVVVMFILSIIIFISTSAIISYKLTKKIIVPLDMLNYGAEQIKNGNLEFNINYDVDDEFGTAISNFDDMRQRLQQSIQSQLKYEEDRKELVAGISHDLRTPLTAIKGYVKGLKDGIANTTEKQQHYHDVIYTKANEMDVLVDKLFLFSKLDTGHLPFYFNKVYCKEYFDSFIKNVREDYESKGLKIVYSNLCSSDIAFKIDIDQMNRVFNNILENSVKYKLSEICNVDFNVIADDDEVIIDISDDGNGVPEEILPNLFKSFYRGDTSRSNPRDSSGLGLSIAERIVKAHNGTIVAQNKNGLDIIIKLPVAKEQ
ncbi:Adaptive-response sensory-kinase SasA [anaerobic digester metagenome]